MTSPESFPDIEIYLKKVPTPDILDWLRSTFKEVTITETAPATQCVLDGAIACTISENVAKGGYTSVWFKTNQTPWATDLDCARAAFAHFDAETRCSTGGWEGEDDGGWLRITDKGEQRVNWHT